MRVVVTGAYGQLGGELCRQLGSRAVGWDIDTVDLTQGPTVPRRLLEVRPAVVVNCAAYTHVDQAELEQGRCRAVNVLAVENLVRACRDLDCPLVQLSTDYVFGGQPDRHAPYRETDPPAPHGVYAETKLQGEQLATGWPKHFIVRTCGLYARASDNRAHNFVKTILHLAGKRRELKVVDDQHCTPSYVPHVARAIRFLAGLAGKPAAPWGVYHVTNRGSTTWYEFAAEILRRAGREVDVRPISTAEYGPAAPRPAYSVLDTTAYHHLGGPAMPDWKAALAEFFADWKISRRSNGKAAGKRSPAKGA